MIAISKSVSTIVQRSPFLREALVNDLINLSGLARQLQPEVEAKFLKPASIGSIVMALQRLKSKLETTTIAKGLQQSMTADISVRSNLVLYIFEYSKDILTAHQAIAQQLNKQHNVFLNLSYGVTEVSCIVNADHDAIVKKYTRKLKQLDHRQNLSAITLRFLFDTVDTPGVYYRILQALAWENINFIEIMSAGNELTLVFDEAGVETAWPVIKKLLKP